MTEGLNFSYSDDHLAIQDLAKKAAAQHLKPIIEEDEKTAKFRPEVIQEFGKLGLTGIPMAADYDGAGMGYLDYVIALEEVSAVSVAYSISIAVTGLTQIIIQKFGNEEQKKKYIPPLARGEHIGSFALTEPDSGSDAATLKTKAVKKGDKYVLTGTKLYCTQANDASTTIVFARTGAEGPKGISAFIVKNNSPGVSIGKIEKKMGLNISQTCELVLENVEVPKENLIGEEGIGFKVALSALDSGRITIGSTAVGLSREAFEFATEFSKTRKQFGKPINAFQGVGFKLADMYTAVQASRLLVQQAAYLRDKNLPYTQQASAAKLFSTDTAMKVTTEAVQVLGGNGYIQDYPVERYMREAKVLQIVEGTNEIQHLVISRNL